jgi:acetyltransferase
MSELPAAAGERPAEACRYPAYARLRDGTQVIVRPIAPQDADREQAFVRGLSPESRYFRFMSTLSELSPQLLERFTHPDAQREIALVALTGAEESDSCEQIAVARCVRIDADGPGEFAIVVADRFQGRGLGHLLMRELVDCARARGWPRIEGLVLWNNTGMLELMRALGFAITPSPDDAHLRVATLVLNGNAEGIRHDQ